MSGIPDLAKLAKTRNEKARDAYQDKLKVTIAKTLDLFVEEGIESCAQAYDLINGLKLTLDNIMGSTPLKQESK